MFLCDANVASGVDVFRAAANAAFAASKVPAYVSYRVDTSARYGSAMDATSATVVIRTIDGKIQPTVQFDGEPTAKVASPPPIPGIYDTLSDFSLFVNMSLRKPVLTAYASTPKPLIFDTRTAAERGVDSVSTVLRAYDVQIADDTPSEIRHLRLVIRDSVKATYTHWFTDVYVDANTLLPTRVVIQGNDALREAIDYQVIEDHWVITHVSFEWRLPAPAHIGKVPADFESDYHNYRFSE